MNQDQLKSYNFEDDQLPPKFILEHLKAHDSKMSALQPEMGLVKASYLTKFWRHVEGQERTGSYNISRLDQIEVNRIKPAISGYLSALYPRRIEVIMAPSPYTTGDHTKAEMVVNDWLNTPKMRNRILSASRQALLYKGSGCKIGYDPAGEGLERVWMRVVPYWELLLDKDVHDVDDMRFIGHVSYRPKKEIVDEYGLDEEDISGQMRSDYLQDKHLDTRGANKDSIASSDNDAFVRVLEFCNLVDDFIDSDGTRYKGRLEIYLLNEDNEDEPTPIYMGALPLVSPRGNKALPHICPLIFEHEPEFPLRGLAYADQLMPQQKELNALRSFTSIASRRDSRIYLARKGALDADAFADLRSGEDGLIIEVDEQFAGNLRDVVIPLQHGPLSSNIMNAMQIAENDIEKQVTLSPAALGMVTNATAEEVRAVERHTESEFGRHAEMRDMWLLDIVTRCLAAHVASMYDTGDSEGAEEHVDAEGVEKEELQESDEENVEELQESKSEEEYNPHMMYDKESGEKEFADTEDEHEQLKSEGWDHGDDDEETVQPERKEEETQRVEEQKLMLKTPDGEFIEVSGEDLDSDFDIGFAESGRSPATEAEMRQNLTGLMDRILALYDVMSQGGHMSVLAEQLLYSLHDRFQLPPNLHPDYLRSQMVEKGIPSPEDLPPAPPEGEMPPEEGAPPPEAGAPPAQPETAPPQQNPEEILQQIEQMHPEDALNALEAVFQDNPDGLKLIEQARALPETEQIDAVRAIIQAIRESM